MPPRSFVRAASALLATVLACGAAWSQTVPRSELQPGAESARNDFERRVQACNRAQLPDPEREACIRQAGVALDRRLDGPPADVAVPTPDGRATVIAPAGSLPRASVTEPVTSPDGRATIVKPQR